MQQEPSLRRQHQRVQDAKHRVNGVRIGRLEDLAAAFRGIPTGMEIAARHLPFAIFQPNLSVRIRVGQFRGRTTAR